MSSKRRLRRRGCEGKIAHATWAAAYGEAGRLRRFHDGGAWKAYRCRFCGLYHVGRPSARQRQAIRDGRAARAG